jgi:hypothetical protein
VKMVKVLQLAVVAMFVLVFAAGVLVLSFAPNRIDEFGQLVSMLFPLFLAQVIPALIGSPLTDYIRARAHAVTAKVYRDYPAEPSGAEPAPEKAPE